MFGNLGNIGQLMNLMKNAGQIKQNMQAMNERLQAARIVGESGAGQVRATVDGRGEIVALKIDPALITAGDVEMIEDLVCGAVRDAVTKSREVIQKETQDAFGISLPGMGDLLGQ
jgi:DNA-binding YbaB/EbfC family protein